METVIHYETLSANETKVALLIESLREQGFKTCIFGAGNVGSTEGYSFLKTKCLCNIDFYCDNNETKWNTYINSIKCISPTELENIKDKVVCIVFDQLRHIEIKKQLVKMQIAHLIPIDLNSSLVNIKQKMDDLEKFVMLKEIAPDLLRRNLFIKNQNVLAKDCLPEFLHNQKNTIRTMLWQVLTKSHTFGSVKPEDSWDLHIEITKDPAYVSAALSSLIIIGWRCKEDDEKAQTIKEIFNRNFYYIKPNNVYHYINYLMQRDEQEDALKILYKFKNIINSDNILCLFPAASYLAYKEKLFDNKLINLSAKLYTTLIKNEKEFILENYLKNKTVAIVGNGPYEFGTGNGEIIDSYDVVVRFNNFSTEPEYQSDYGRKTNIRAHEQDVGCRNNYDIEIITVYDFASYNLLNSLDKIDMAKLVPIPNAILSDIYKKHFLSWTSSGIRTVYYIKSILGDKLKKENIFGFALRDNYVSSLNDYNHKYGYHPYSDWCNFHAELKVLQDLFY